MEKVNVLKEVRELKNQMAYSKNIGFFLGAGSSCALGIPNIQGLTASVQESLSDESKKIFQILMDDIKPQMRSGAEVNIEGVLNQIRKIRDLTGDSGDKTYLGIDGEVAADLDSEICKSIYRIITEKESVAELASTKRFLSWLSMQNRDFAKEIFTTNYDLILERSLEETQIPYFDGFVGSFEPFFWQESIDKFVSSSDLTQKWLRLWKIHGSLSWFWKKGIKDGANKIVRLGKVSKVDDEQNELVIYPSKEKYDSSRKQPFIAYFDRLKNYLLNGELLFVFSGYSFSDQHINEIIFNCLRQNHRLFIIIFFFKDSEVEALYSTISTYLNVSVYGPKKAIINGTLSEWEFNKDELKPNEDAGQFWSAQGNSLLLGDFNKLSSFLVSNSGKKSAIEAMIND